jgi:hypothetical protein
MRGMPAFLVFVVFVIFAVLAAFLVSGQESQPLAAAVLGGALAAGMYPRPTPASQPEPAALGGGEDSGHNGHPLGRALERYARRLEPGRHTVGGDAAVEAARTGPKEATRPWITYETWSALAKDAEATAHYLAQRADVLHNPNLDWAPVLRVMGPKLADKYEYIGLVNLEPDGKTLRLEAYEASPVEMGTTGSETTWASVPEELVEKYAERPALIIFHTHPADPRGSPMPSSHDLSCSIYLSALSRFAASAVISRYGVFMYALDKEGDKAVHNAADMKLAMLHLSHDVVVAHEALRSWSSHTLPEYLAFYPRHMLTMTVYPTPEMIGDSRRYTYHWNIEAPVDYDLAASLVQEILARKKARSQKKNEKQGKKGEAREGEAREGAALGGSWGPGEEIPQKYTPSGTVSDLSQSLEGFDLSLD